MADTTISNLSTASYSELTPQDLLVVVNNGTTKNTTLSAIIQTTSLSYIPYLDATIIPTVSLVNSNYTKWNIAYNTINSNGSLWSNHTLGSDNVSIGIGNLSLLTSGYKNTSVGTSALSSNTSGSGNVAFGYQTLAQNMSGSGNTAIGYNAGYANVTGINNTYIGNQATGHCSNESHAIILGNSSVKTLRCQAATITSLSDERDKKNIYPISFGLNFINKLIPVKFEWNARDGSKINEQDMGFIAQDLQSVQQANNWIVPGLVDITNPDSLQASYGKLIPILVKAIQELSDQVEELKKKC